MRGRNKIGNKMAAGQKQLLEGERNKNKLKYLKEVTKDRLEQKIVEQDLEFLGKHDKKFDPVDNLKRQKQDE
jgi:hypothetical protein